MKVLKTSIFFKTKKFLDNSVNCIIWLENDCKHFAKLESEHQIFKVFKCFLYIYIYIQILKIRQKKGDQTSNF